MDIFSLIREVGRLKGEKERRDKGLNAALGIGASATNHMRGQQRQAESQRYDREQGEISRGFQRERDARNDQREDRNILAGIQREEAREAERKRDNDARDAAQRATQERFETSQAGINERFETSQRNTEENIIARIKRKEAEDQEKETVKTIKDEREAFYKSIDNDERERKERETVRSGIAKLDIDADQDKVRQIDKRITEDRTNTKAQIDAIEKKKQALAKEMKTGATAESRKQSAERGARATARTKAYTEIKEEFKGNAATRKIEFDPINNPEHKRMLEERAEKHYRIKYPEGVTGEEGGSEDDDDSSDETAFRDVSWGIGGKGGPGGPDDEDSATAEELWMKHYKKDPDYIKYNLSEEEEKFANNLFSLLPGDVRNIADQPEHVKIQFVKREYQKFINNPEGYYEQVTKNPPSEMQEKGIEYDNVTHGLMTAGIAGVARGGVLSGIKNLAEEVPESLIEESLDSSVPLPIFSGMNSIAKRRAGERGAALIPGGDDDFFNKLSIPGPKSGNAPGREAAWSNLYQARREKTITEEQFQAYSKQLEQKYPSKPIAQKTQAELDAEHKQYVLENPKLYPEEAEFYTTQKYNEDLLNMKQDKLEIEYRTVKSAYDNATGDAKTALRKKLLSILELHDPSLAGKYGDAPINLDPKKLPELKPSDIDEEAVTDILGEGDKFHNNILKVQNQAKWDQYEQLRQAYDAGKITHDEFIAGNQKLDIPTIPDLNHNLSKLSPAEQQARRAAIAGNARQGIQAPGMDDLKGTDLGDLRKLEVQDNIDKAAFKVAGTHVNDDLNTPLKALNEAQYIGGEVDRLVIDENIRKAESKLDTLKKWLPKQGYPVGTVIDEQQKFPAAYGRIMEEIDLLKKNRKNYDEMVKMGHQKGMEQYARWMNMNIAEINKRWSKIAPAPKSAGSIKMNQLNAMPDPTQIVDPPELIRAAARKVIEAPKKIIKKFQDIGTKLGVHADPMDVAADRAIAASKLPIGEKLPPEIKTVFPWEDSADAIPEVRDVVAPAVNKKKLADQAVFKKLQPLTASKTFKAGGLADEQIAALFKADRKQQDVILNMMTPEVRKAALAARREIQRLILIDRGYNPDVILRRPTPGTARMPVGKQQSLFPEMVIPNQPITDTVPVVTGKRTVTTTFPGPATEANQGRLFPDMLGPTTKESENFVPQEMLDEFVSKLARGEMTARQQENFFKKFKDVIDGTHITKYPDDPRQTKMFEDALGPLTKSREEDVIDFLPLQGPSKPVEGVEGQQKTIFSDMLEKAKNFFTGSNLANDTTQLAQINGKLAESIAKSKSGMEIIETLTDRLTRNIYLKKPLQEARKISKKMSGSQQYYTNWYLNAVRGTPGNFAGGIRAVAEEFGLRPDALEEVALGLKMAVSRATIGLNSKSAIGNAVLGAINNATGSNFTGALDKFLKSKGKTLTGETLEDLGLIERPRVRIGYHPIKKAMDQLDAKVLFKGMDVTTKAPAGLGYWQGVMEAEAVGKAKGMSDELLADFMHKQGIKRALKMQNMGDVAEQAGMFSDPYIGTLLQFVRPAAKQATYVGKDLLFGAAKGNVAPLAKFILATGGIVYLADKLGDQNLYDKLKEMFFIRSGGSSTPVGGAIGAAQSTILSTIKGDTQTREEEKKGRLGNPISKWMPGGTQAERIQRLYFPMERQLEEQTTLMQGLKQDEYSDGEKFKQAFMPGITRQKVLENNLNEARKIDDDDARKDAITKALDDIDEYEEEKRKRKKK